MNQKPSKLYLWAARNTLRADSGRGRKETRPIKYSEWRERVLEKYPPRPEETGPDAKGATVTATYLQRAMLAGVMDVIRAVETGNQKVPDWVHDEMAKENDALSTRAVGAMPASASGR